MSLSALLATFMRAPVAASAFSVTGDTWQENYQGLSCGSDPFVGWVPCYVYLQTSSTLNGRYGWQTTAYWADSQWYAIDPNSGSRLVFSYEHDTSSLTGNEVYMNASDLGWCSTCNTNTLGYASWSTSGLWGNDLSYVDIEINTNSAANWYVEANGGTIGTTQNSLEENMTHELGHALGLDHAASGPYAGMVMQACQTGGEEQLVATDDYNGEMYLYSGHGGYGSPTGNYSC